MVIFALSIVAEIHHSVILISVMYSNFNSVWVVLAELIEVSQFRSAFLTSHRYSAFLEVFMLELVFKIFDWICKHIDTLIASFSALIALLTFINTSSIKATIKKNIVQEQFSLNKAEILKNLTKCQQVAQLEKVRPANDAKFNELMNKSLNFMDRYFSLDKTSEEYKSFSSTKSDILSLLSKRSAEDLELDIRQNAGLYGCLIGRLEELVENGRIS